MLEFFLPKYKSNFIGNYLVSVQNLIKAIFKVEVIF